MSSARRRTMVRMKYLATLSAAGIAAACTGGGGSDDNIIGGGGGTDGGRDGNANNPDAYGVVDPLPSPSCFETAKPQVTAKYTNDTGDAGADADAEPADAGDGSRLVEIEILFDASTDIVVESRATTTNAKIVRSNVSATGGTVIVRVPALATTAEVRLCYTCSSAGPGSVDVGLTLGPTVKVQTNDRQFQSCGPK